MREALISIHPRFVEAILAGTKTVELRTRTPSLEIGARLWIYSTMPEARVRGTARVERLVTCEPGNIWSEFSNCMAVSKRDYLEYCGDRRSVCAIVLREIEELRSEITLGAARLKDPAFHPPQFIKDLTGKSIMSELFLPALC